MMKNDKNVIIKIIKNGPLHVKNLIKFTNSRHEKIETKTTMVLCRCGSSKNKPFCDGTHGKIGWTSEKQEGRQLRKVDSYVGKKITIHDTREICTQNGYCTEHWPKVFCIYLAYDVCYTIADISIPSTKTDHPLKKFNIHGKNILCQKLKKF